MDIPIADRAVRLDADDREEQFKEHQSFAAREKRYRRWLYHRIPWTVAASLFGIAMVQDLAIYRLTLRKEPPVRVVPVDQSTGWIGTAATPTDAPKLFTEKSDVREIEQYVENRYGYYPDTDQHQWQVVRAMSSSGEFERYNAWRKSDDAPIKRLGTDGHVDVLNVNAGGRTVEKNGTISYLVRYQLREIRQRSVSPPEAWHVTIDFQWHPEMTMSTLDEKWNPGGFQVIHTTQPEKD